MVRTQIQLEETMYRELKRLAYFRGASMGRTIRDLLAQALVAGQSGGKKPGKLKLSDFRFIGSHATGRRHRDSERHDEILGDEW